MEEVLNIYKLKFQTAMHISRGKLNSYESSSSTLHSDSLKSAIFVSILQLYGEKTAFEFLENVCLSSAFPFEGDSYYLPRPISYKPVENAENRKSLKKLAFLTTSQLQSVLNAEHPSISFDSKGRVIQPQVWAKDITQRVKISTEEESKPFYMEKLYPLNQNTGLYFIYKGEFSTEKLDAAMKLLGENGIGLQRNLGNGRFIPEKDSVKIKLPDSATAWMSLSLYRPDKDDLNETFLAGSSYQFIKRGGWVSSSSEENMNYRKQAIIMFTEGSTFCFSDKIAKVMIAGKLEDITPDVMVKSSGYKIFRDGRSIFLPII